MTPLALAASGSSSLKWGWKGTGFTCRTITEPSGVLGTQEPRRGTWRGACRLWAGRGVAPSQAHPTSWLPGRPQACLSQPQGIRDPAPCPLVLPAQVTPHPPTPRPAAHPGLHYHRPRAVPTLLGGAFKTSPATTQPSRCLGHLFPFLQSYSLSGKDRRGGRAGVWVIGLLHPGGRAVVRWGGREPGKPCGKAA